MTGSASTRVRASEPRALQRRSGYPGVNSLFRGPSVAVESVDSGKVKQARLLADTNGRDAEEGEGPHDRGAGRPLARAVPPGVPGAGRQGGRAAVPGVGRARPPHRPAVAAG